jgi:hypothetical protein
MAIAPSASIDSVMSPRPRDTSEAAWQQQRAVLAKLGPEGRCRVAADLSESVRAIRLAAIRARHPDWTQRDAVRHLVEQEFGVRQPGSERE